MEIAELRREFPVLGARAYMNAGTNGPVPARAARAAGAELERELDGGRAGTDYWARTEQLSTETRAGLASLLGADPGAVALTRSTTDGVECVLRGFPFEPGDEILTSEEEHAGLLGPLAEVRRRLGVTIRRAPFDRIADHVGANTRLVAVSHVSWMTGAIAPVEALAALELPLLFDGAQALGAIPVDVRRLDCAFYAGSGQKWLCGPTASGALYVAPEWTDRLGIPSPRYATLDETRDPLDGVARPGALRFDSGEMPNPTLAWLNESLKMFGEAGWENVHAAAAAGAADLRERLAGKLDVIPGDRTTLVSFEVGDDPPGLARRLDELGVVVRPVPGRPWLRASVGAWNNAEDAERLVGAL